MKTILKKILPRPYYEKFKRYAIYGLSDAWDSVSGQRDELVPPKRMIFIGGAAYKEIGDEFFAHFKTHGKLKPTDTVLDVGCGIGRMARPLTGYLSSGRYEGVDIDRNGIDWCVKNITKRFPNFKFQVADVFNKHYNPGGKSKASEYRFPFPDGTFDFVFLTSVFTHMFPEDVENYLREISRVMKNGGRCLITYFILNRESSDLIGAGRSQIDFKSVTPEFYVMDKDVPEDATCFTEEYIRKIYERFGVRIEEPIRYGSWCGREKSLSYQDIVIASKL